MSLRPGVRRSRRARAVPVPGRRCPAVLRGRKGIVLPTTTVATVPRVGMGPSNVLRPCRISTGWLEDPNREREAEHGDDRAGRERRRDTDAEEVLGREVG